MNKAPIKITLKFFANECMGRPYEVVKLVNAVAPKYPNVENPANYGEDATLHIGDRLSEKAAQKLVELYEVTTVPA